VNDQSDTYGTLVVLENGERVRASETLETVHDRYMLACPILGGVFAVADPGDGRSKLIPATSVSYFEVEPE
jgi:hypothetical protein